MNTSLSAFPAIVWTVAVLSSPLVFGQEKSPYQPQLTNSKSGDLHDFPLGVLSATGRLKDKDREILVKHVGPGGVADRGGLKAGDRIVGIGGRPIIATFYKSTDSGLEGPQSRIAYSMDAVCARPPHLLALAIKRGDQRLNLTFKLPQSPRFVLRLSDDCPKSRQYLADIVNHLAATQRRDGSWRPGVGGDADVYMSAFCALALIAADNKSHLPAIKRAIEFIRRKSITTIDVAKPQAGPKNWQTASSAILLAEYQLATGDRSYSGDLKTCCDFLAARVSANGTMGHHFQIPYNGGGLVIINTQAHLAWALAEKCGTKIDADAWNRSFAEVRKSIDKRTGAIGYSSRAPRSPDIAARTGAMAAALAIAGKERRLAKQLAAALVAKQGRMRHAHAMSSIGLIYGFSGIKLGSPQQHRDVLRRWRPYLELSRTAAGPAAYFGGKRNIGGDEYLGLEPIGNATVALMLAGSEGKLFMHGGTKPDWFGKAAKR